MQAMQLRSSQLAPGAAATLAGVWEATAPKPGNVHPGASFEDATYADFVASAVVIGPIMERAAAVGVGQTVLDAVRATREVTGTNTNLGMLLLLAPLAAAPSGTTLAAGIGRVLASLTAGDTRLVYEAIRISGAGSLGRCEEADVFGRDAPDQTLVEVMRLAAERDLIARQFVTDFRDVFRIGEWVADAGCRRIRDSIVYAHVRQLAASPDSLIARKCGEEVARQASDRAAAVLAAGRPGETGYVAELAELDGWLRADAHRRNPGATADLIGAGLFVLLREGRLDWTDW